MCISSPSLFTGLVPVASPHREGSTSLPDSAVIRSHRIKLHLQSIPRPASASQPACSPCLAVCLSRSPRQIITLRYVSSIRRRLVRLSAFSPPSVHPRLTAHLSTGPRWWYCQCITVLSITHFINPSSRVTPSAGRRVLPAACCMHLPSTHDTVSYRGIRLDLQQGSLPVSLWSLCL